MDSLDHELDIIGQRPLNLYTQICSFYSLPDASSHSMIIDTLTKGLERLTAAFPWIAGQVVNEGATSGDSGIFKIKPLEKTLRFMVKDLRDQITIPTMAALRSSNFPYENVKFPWNMLDESVICPRNTFPVRTHEATSDALPVFLVQASFIEGGLVLAFLGHHQVMDMTGQGAIISLLDRACRGDTFTEPELAVGNLSRQNMIPFFDKSWSPSAEITSLLTKPVEIPAEDTPATWTYFNFSSSSLKSLKASATESIILPTGSYISTDDTLTAFLWKHVARARLSRLDSSVESTLARAVDSRRYLNIAASYLGFVQDMSNHTHSLQEVAGAPLGSLALELREAVDPETSKIGYTTRALATVLNRSKDKNILSPVAKVDISTGLMLSSWVKIDSYWLEFGLGLGKLEAVRRPQFVPVKSLGYLMPKGRDGSIAVAICLRNDDLERLREDGEFVKYGEEIL